MDWQLIVSLIGSLGFPIVACIYMFRYLRDVIQLINNNTQAIQELTAKLNNLIP